MCIGRPFHVIGTKIGKTKLNKEKTRQSGKAVHIAKRQTRNRCYFHAPLTNATNGKNRVARGIDRMHHGRDRERGCYARGGVLELQIDAHAENTGRPKILGSGGERERPASLPVLGESEHNIEKPRAITDRLGDKTGKKKGLGDESKEVAGYVEVYCDSGQRDAARWAPVSEGTAPDEGVGLRHGPSRLSRSGRRGSQVKPFRLLGHTSPSGWAKV